MIVHCAQGLGNRVAAMANGLSRAAEIRFAWAINAHCPATAADLFPRGIEGVEFVAAEAADDLSEWDGRTCERWDAVSDRAAADAAYGRVMAAMIGRPRHVAEAAICYRSHRNPSANPEALADETAWHTGGAVFVFADQHRNRIAARLTSLGIEALMPTACELRYDLGRSKASVRAYAADWQTLLASGRIIACNGPASALHPARAAGIKIVYV